MSVTKIQDRLVREDPNFRRLVEKHRDLDERLLELQRRRWLTEAQQVEEVELKKKKLALKDEMESILSRASA